MIFAVKPQDMEMFYNKFKMDNKLFISIAAGLTTKFFEKHLGGKARVVRAMPNMPALIGEGITGICAGRYATRADVKYSQRNFKSHWPDCDCQRIHDGCCYCRFRQRPGVCIFVC